MTDGTNIFFLWKFLLPPSPLAQGHSEDSCNQSVRTAPVLYMIFRTAHPFVTRLSVMSENILVSQSCEKIRLLCLRLRSWQRFRTSINAFVANLGMAINHHKPECRPQNWDAVFKVKARVRAHVYNQNRTTLTILVYINIYVILLNCWSFCDQTLFDVTLS